MIKYSKNITLFPSYFDLNDKIKLQSIFSIFQDVACEHGEKMGVGFLDMLQRDLYWIVTRIKFDILQQPKTYQEVICETIPHGKGRVDFDRDFLIKDLNHNVLIKGTSKWCVISSKTRKLMLPSEVPYPTNDEYSEDFVYPEKFIKTPSIKRHEKADFEHVVSYHEIDHNMHLNNVNYANYVFDAIKCSDTRFLQLNFISECILGDKIEIFKEEKDGEILVAGYVGDTLKFSALVKI